jgi:GGDEF domain-containing protein
MLRHAVRHRQDFTLLCIALSAKQGQLTEAMVEQVSLALKRAIRQTDTLARTGAAEFTITTASLDAQASRGFGERLCRLVTSSVSDPDKSAPIIAACGLVSVAEFPGAQANVPPALHDLWDAARRRCMAGLHAGVSGAVGAAEESSLKNQAG